MRRSPPSTSLVASGDDTITNNCNSPSCAVSKKRKTTYYARKDEADELRKTVSKLTGQLKTLQERHAHAQRPLYVSLVTNAMLKSCVKQQRRMITATQSMASCYTAHADDLPLGSYIRLPEDKASRQQIIHNMRPQKINGTIEYLLQRSEFMDLRRPSRQMENYVTDAGDHVAIHWEITCFEDHSPSVAEVFSDMEYFVGNQELEMAEKLGSVSIRESEFSGDSIDSSQIRMVSTHIGNIHAELNLVLYSQFSPRSDERLRRSHRLSLRAGSC